MSLLDWIWPKRASKTPEPKAVVTFALSKRGLWRWQVRDADGMSVALMPGRGYEEFSGCLADARRLTDVRLTIVPPPAARASCGTC